jgi:Ca-activated chloride channel family protein
MRKLLFLVASVLMLSNAYSQDKKPAAIGGFVKDARTKAPLKEAVVTVSSDAFEGQKWVLTDTTGLYRISNLPAGNYIISFEMDGYKKFTQENIFLKEGMSLGVSFEMIKEAATAPPAKKSANLKSDSTS